MKSKQSGNSNSNIRKILKKLISKCLLTVIVFLIGMILVKQNPALKKVIRKNVYETSLKFTEMKKAYEKYFGNILSVDKITPTTKEVFEEKLNYQNSSTYKDGVKLTVSKNYLVPAIESGIVVFIGEKENYGNTIIVEQINGINTWYSNVKTTDIKLYDYIDKGSLIGESKDSKIYLVFQKEGKFLDYKKYI